MKKIISLVLCLLLCLSMSVTSFGWSTMPLLVDEADILDEGDEEIILETLEDLSNAHGMDIGIVTVNSTEGKTTEAFADDFYDYNGYAPDGVMLVVDMGSRQWHITTTGKAITAFTEDAFDHLEDNFLGELSDGNYYGSFMGFAYTCDEIIGYYENGTPYDADNIPHTVFDYAIAFLICMGVGILTAVIVVVIMALKLKSVHAEGHAANYVKEGSFHLTRSNDVFLYRNIIKHPKPKDSDGGGSTHISSSGASHGGRGGGF